MIHEKRWSNVSEEATSVVTGLLSANPSYQMIVSECFHP